MQHRTYQDEELIKAVETSTSYAEVMSRIGLKRGGNYKYIKNNIKRLELDISHFKGQGWGRGRIIGPKYPINDYLSNQKFITSHHLRQRLIKENILEAKCYSCNLRTWLDKPIPLELHHIDGNNKNHNLSNLIILCPNCHTLTDNYGVKNTKTYKEKMRHERVELS